MFNHSNCSQKQELASGILLFANRVMHGCERQRKRSSVFARCKRLHSQSLTYFKVSQSSIGALATALIELGRGDAADIVLGTSPLLQIVAPSSEAAGGPSRGLAGPLGTSFGNSKVIPESHPQNSGLAFSQSSGKRALHSSTGLSSASSTSMSR